MSAFPTCEHGFGDPNNLNPCPFCAAVAVNEELAKVTRELAEARADNANLKENLATLGRDWQKDIEERNLLRLIVASEPKS